MKYYIKPNATRDEHYELINKDEYIEIIQARSLVLDVLLFVDVFTYVVENFNELQEGIPDSQEIITNFTTYNLDIAHLCNRRIINFLSTCKLYLDLFEFKQNKNIMAGEYNFSLRGQIRRIRAYYFQNNFTFIFFLRLRNYVQHHRPPFKGFSIKAKINDLKTIRNPIIEFIVDMEKLANNSTFNWQHPQFQINFKEELQLLQKETDIIPLIDDYIDLLVKIHKSFKNIVKPPFEDARKLLYEKVIYYCKTGHQSFNIFKENEPGEVIEQFDISRYTWGERD